MARGVLVAYVNLGESQASACDLAGPRRRPADDDACGYVSDDDDVAAQDSLHHSSHLSMTM